MQILRTFNLSILLILLVYLAGCKSEDLKTKEAAMHARNVLNGGDPEQNQNVDQKTPHSVDHHEHSHDNQDQIDWSKINTGKIAIKKFRIEEGDGLYKDKMAIKSSALKEKIMGELAAKGLLQEDGEPFNGVVIYNTDTMANQGLRTRLITLIGNFTIDTPKAQLPVRANMVLERDFGKADGSEEKPEMVEKFYREAIQLFIEQIVQQLSSLLASPTEIKNILENPDTLPETQMALLHRIGLEQIKGLSHEVRQLLSSPDPMIAVTAAQVSFETGDKGALPKIAEAAQRLYEKKAKELEPLMVIMTKIGGEDARHFLQWMSATDRNKFGVIARNLLKVGEEKGLFAKPGPEKK